MTDTLISENVIIPVLLNHFFMFTESKCGKNARMNLSTTNKANAKGNRINPSIILVFSFILSFFDSNRDGIFMDFVFGNTPIPVAVIKTSIANINQFSDENAINVMSYHFVYGKTGNLSSGVS